MQKLPKTPNGVSAPGQNDPPAHFGLLPKRKRPSIRKSQNPESGPRKVSKLRLSRPKSVVLRDFRGRTSRSDEFVHLIFFRRTILLNDKQVVPGKTNVDTETIKILQHTPNSTSPLKSTQPLTCISCSLLVALNSCD